MVGLSRWSSKRPASRWKRNGTLARCAMSWASHSSSASSSRPFQKQERVIQGEVVEEARVGTHAVGPIPEVGVLQLREPTIREAIPPPAIDDLTDEHDVVSLRIVPPEKGDEMICVVSRFDQWAALPGTLRH